MIDLYSKRDGTHYTAKQFTGSSKDIQTICDMIGSPRYEVPVYLSHVQTYIELTTGCGNSDTCNIGDWVVTRKYGDGMQFFVCSTATIQDSFEKTLPKYVNNGNTDNTLFCDPTAIRNRLELLNEGKYLRIRCSGSGELYIWANPQRNRLFIGRVENGRLVEIAGENLNPNDFVLWGYGSPSWEVIDDIDEHLESTREGIMNSIVENVVRDAEAKGFVVDVTINKCTEISNER